MDILHKKQIDLFNKSGRDLQEINVFQLLQICKSNNYYCYNVEFLKYPKNASLCPRIFYCHSATKINQKSVFCWLQV